MITHCPRKCATSDTMATMLFTWQSRQVICLEDKWSLFFSHFLSLAMPKLASFSSVPSRKPQSVFHFWNESALTQTHILGIKKVSNRCVFWAVQQRNLNEHWLFPKTGSKLVIGLTTETGAKTALHLQSPDVTGPWRSPLPICAKHRVAIPWTFGFECLCLDVLVLLQ